ncbi:MAG: truncated hemoglobin [Arenimonas sp.]|nr:truncated hemoglobin [Arenimonas sp.]
MAMQDDLIGRAANRAEIIARAQAQMAEMGIDRAFIDRLVETFYGRIQAHPRLGPVFDTRLSGRWPEHLAKMKAFWTSIAFKNGAYGGKPVQAHHGLAGITEGLFVEWLALFSETLDDMKASEEARRWFMATADRIARSLVTALFCNPALENPTRRV